MNLFSLVPFPYRLLALAVLALALWGYGYVKGLRQGEGELTAYRAAIELAAVEQEKSTALVTAHQKETTTHVAQDYEQRLAALRARLASVRDPGPGRSELPLVAGHPQGPDGTTEELPAHCADPELAARAAEDALKIVAFQEWVVKQGITITDNPGSYAKSGLSILVKPDS